MTQARIEYKKSTRVIRLFALWMAMALFLCACHKKETEPPDSLAFTAPASSGAPRQDDTPYTAPADTQQSPPQVSPQPDAPAPGQSGGVTILDTVAYPFSGMLYGGVAYKNTGSTPIVLQEATFTFTFSGGTQSNTFAPVAWENDVVLPGETAYCTLWLPYEGASAASPVTLTATLQVRNADRQQRPLQVGSAHIIQNYPRFATLSGRLSNATEEASDLCMVYAAFYDESERLLGIWFFPYNAVLQPGNGTAFVVQLESLPVPNLAESTKTLRFRAFSMI